MKVDLNTYQRLIRQTGSLPIKKHKRVARQVAMILLTYINFKSGRCDPAERSLAKDLDISERSVRNGLLALSEAGLIRIRTRKGRTNQYDLLFINPGKFEQTHPGKFEQVPRQVQVDTPASLNTDPGKFEQRPRNERATEQVRTSDSTYESTNEENSTHFCENRHQPDSNHDGLMKMAFATFRKFKSDISFDEFVEILSEYSDARLKHMIQYQIFPKGLLQWTPKAASSGSESRAARKPDQTKLDAA